MKIETLEAEVLKLPKDTQAALLARLLAHLGQRSDIDQNVADIWVEEAEVRDREMDSNQDLGIPASQVFHELYASLN
jgi:Putative addiction module component